MPGIVEEKLEEKRGYSPELRKSIIEEVRRLINSPHAIQRQLSLDDTRKSVKFLVAAKNTKGGYYTCTIQYNTIQYLYLTWSMHLAISYFTDMPRKINK